MYNKPDFDSDFFRRQFHYDGPLGFSLEKNRTVFRLWAPTAGQVTLFLYPDGDHSSKIAEYAMQAEGHGVWSKTLEENLDGCYYDFVVTVDGISRRTPDPYARAAGVNGLRSMVLDLSHTDPEDWALDCPPEEGNENIIYEIHIKDFTWAASSGISPKLRGKYLSLCQSGTSIHDAGTYPSGIDYLKRLGVTHIQLMPVYDFGSVDEGLSAQSPGPDDQFNWGYDPWNYNLPEGSYSTDPAHGEVRIRELKEMIRHLHRSGFRVIMDVVYNHTYHLDSCLFRTVPWYFYRRNPDGSPSNGSGCGNDLASERSMCARYILDSVLYWCSEYHMDGFRFDLMGLLDTGLMNRIREELDRIYGPGEKLLYGEPWRAGESAVHPSVRLADKQAFRVLSPQIGAFCDATRDAIKGDLMRPDSKGMVNGGKLSAVMLASCLTGWTDSGKEFCVQSPSQTITYLSCHDDWTLWDRLLMTVPEGQDPERINRLAAAINFCCQGNLFLLSGEEAARTKCGVRDSVQSPYRINRFDWNRVEERINLVDYYRGLIALRKELPGLCDKSKTASDRLHSCRELSCNLVYAEIDNRSSKKKTIFSRLILIVNASDETHNISLPAGNFRLFFNGENSFLWQEDIVIRESISLPSYTAALLGKTE